jgi:pseudouridine synthase
VNDTSSAIRLQKILSQAGVASRRAAEKLIEEGRVSVNGHFIREMGVKADPRTDDIRVDGRRLRLPDRHRYILLNKPAGVVSTRSDPQRRQTVVDLLGRMSEYIYPVGRLDYDSEGLLLLTNDGDLAARLTHPRHEVERTYEAHVAGTPGDEAIDRLRHGIPLDGKRTMPAEVKLLTRGTGPRKGAPYEPRGAAASKGAPFERRGAAPRKGAAYESREAAPRKAVPYERRVNGVLLITIREGRNRQVRRMCEAVGHPVRKLRRVRIGPITDRRLRPGEWRDLSAHEVKQLKDLADAPRPRPAAGRPRPASAR